MPGEEFDSIIYSSDSLQVTRLRIYREADAPDIIRHKNIKRYDDKGRIISDENCDPDETDDEYPPFKKDTYQYTKRRMLFTHQYYRYENGEYTKVSCYKRKYVYNKLGLCKKMVRYDVYNGRRSRDELWKYKYDRKTREPLKQTNYIFYSSLFREQSFKAIWTYE